MLRALGWSLLLSASLLSSCGGKALDCGQVPCPDPLMIWGTLTYKGSDSVHLKVKMCRNAQCSEGEVQAGPLGRAQVSLKGELPAIASLTSLTASDPWQLSVKVNDTSGIDGDKISLKLTELPIDIVIFDKTASSVVYVSSQPNGAECGPSCRSAVVDFHGPP